MGIYFHIPFCEQKCLYCDFTSFVCSRETISKYISCLIKEVQLKQNLWEEIPVDTIFVGGGTPSILDPDEIYKLGEVIKFFNLSKDVEFTVESNPNSLTGEKLKAFKDIGVNRVSTGVQSTNEKLLKSIGRIHNLDQVYKAVENIKSAGIDNINLDFMMALPNESLKDVKENLKHIEVLNPSHISYYSLIIEEGTPMEKIYSSNPSLFPDESEDRKMYHNIVNSLKHMGYHQYEISNFAKEGMECRHNLKYWNLEDYLGFGLSSHSNISNERFWNTHDLNKYIEMTETGVLPEEEREVLTLKDRMNEFTIMGLRLNKGVDGEVFKEKFEKDFADYYKKEIQDMLSEKLCTFDGRYLKTTTYGKDILNVVELTFIK